MIVQQLTVNVLLAASIYTLVGTGFGVVYATTRFFHFAHGIIIPISAYTAFWVSVSCHLPLWAGFAAALFVAMTTGCLMELLVYRPIRNRDGSPLALMLASLGLYVVLQNVLSVLFGDSFESFGNTLGGEGYRLGDARITSVQLLTIAVAVVLVFMVSIFLRSTRTGRCMRAVANDYELTLTCGVHAPRVLLMSFALGSTLAGVAGILIALDTGMIPSMGLNVLLMGVIAAIIGGFGNIPRTAAGALLLAVAQQIGAWCLGSEWRDTVAFLILFGFIAFGRPSTVIRPAQVTSLH